MSQRRQRLDVLLVERALAESRSAAQAMIMAGEVSVDGRRADKPGQRFPEESEIEIESGRQRFASRAGEKLEGALDGFGVDAAGAVALDVGSSTGGFTDCLLRRGAARVYAVDVGRGLLDWRLRQDERVVVMEGVNARHLPADALPEQADLATLDVSFISLTKVLPAVLALLRPGAVVLPMVKPQFEAGREAVGKGGVVRDPAQHLAALRKVARFLYNSGADVVAALPSPLLGPKGNREFFIHAILRPPLGEVERVDTIIGQAIDE